MYGSPSAQFFELNGKTKLKRDLIIVVNTCAELTTLFR